MAVLGLMTLLVWGEVEGWRAELVRVEKKQPIWLKQWSSTQKIRST